MTDPTAPPVHDQACYLKPTFRERMRSRLFPAQHVESDFPEWAGNGDVVFVGAVTNVSWLDRLRIVVTGRVRTEVRVTCEHKVGRTVAVTKQWAEWPEKMESKP